MLPWLTGADLHMRVELGVLFDTASSLWNVNHYRRLFNTLQQIFLPSEWTVLVYVSILRTVNHSLTQVFRTTETSEEAFLAVKERDELRTMSVILTIY
jgi:hypothetical protein